MARLAESGLLIASLCLAVRASTCEGDGGWPVHTSELLQAARGVVHNSSLDGTQTDSAGTLQKWTFDKIVNYSAGFVSLHSLDGVAFMQAFAPEGSLTVAFNSIDETLTFTSLVLWVAVMAMVAGVYASVKPFPPPQVPGDFSLVEGRWQFPLCGCFAEPCLCCLTTFFGPIRWSDNMRMAGIMHFTTAMILSMCGLALVSVRAKGLSIGIVIVWFGLVYFRQKVRAKFDIPSGTCCVLVQDFFTVVFCSCCMVIQEARQLEQAYQAGRDFIGRHMGEENDGMSKSVND